MDSTSGGGGGGGESAGKGQAVLPEAAGFLSSLLFVVAAGLGALVVEQAGAAPALSLGLFESEQAGADPPLASQSKLAS